MGEKGAQAGAKNPNWKGGRSVASNGYVLIKRPDHPQADVRGYVYEHRLVAEQHLGRYLLPGEEVHHVHAPTTDNRWENLEVKASRAEHALEHRTSTLHSRAVRLPGELNPEMICACGCGGTFLRYDAQNRERRYLSSHNRRRRPHG